MCGIFGTVGDPSWVSGLRLDRAVSSMAHRGPDGEGVWRSPSLDAPGGGASPACAIGHTRLSIIDLSDAGRQPMTTADGRFALVYNGEVYNFREIRRELEALGETFSSTGDSEVVLKACVRWGEGAIQRFRGMFALGLWDDQERILLLARDRLGVKPLYVASGPGRFTFASEVRTLLESGAVQRVLSPQGLLGFLRYGSVQEPDTLVAGVRSIPPGTSLVFNGLEAREQPFWALPTGPPMRCVRAEAVARIRELLHESVRLRLVSDVPFGIFLSGGGDSSALAAIASAEASQPVHTFTVVFDEAAFSEERWAAEIAKSYGCIHHSVRVTGEDAAADLTEALQGQDQPSGDGLNSWLVSRAARREGLAMALSGLGGDELFAGYPNFRNFARYVRFSWAARAAPKAVLAFLEARGASPGVSNGFRKAVAIARAGGDAERVYGALRSVFTDSQIRTLAAGIGPACFRSTKSSPHALLRDADFVNLLSRFELAGYLRNTLLRDTDSMSMSSSLEVRVPFLDHKLVEFVLSLPGGMKTEGNGNKPLLFDAVPELPRDVGLRPKMGFVLPLEEWFRGPMKRTMEDSLLGSGRPAASLLARETVAEIWSTFLARRGPISATRVLGLASLATWVNRHELSMPA